MNKKYEKYKEVENAWLDPYGKFYECGYMQHNEWATNYLKKKFKCDYFGLNDKIEPVVGRYGYPHEYLCKQGWLRLLTWSTHIGSKVTGYSDKQKPTGDQESTLLEWCAANGKNYDKLFDLDNK